MMKKFCTLCLISAFTFGVSLATGCAKNEHKVTEKKETTHESEPTDSSPGQMVVE